MTMPITDLDELQRIADTTCHKDGYPTVGHWRLVALAVRDAVCPPDHIVVPKTEYDALRRFVDDVEGSLSNFDPDDAVHIIMDDIAALRAALKEDA